jgi:hypothetical protein
MEFLFLEGCGIVEMDQGNEVLAFLDPQIHGPRHLEDPQARQGDLTVRYLDEVGAGFEAYPLRKHSIGILRIRLLLFGIEVPDEAGIAGIGKDVGHP